jgi:hypothetical protein
MISPKHRKLTQNTSLSTENGQKVGKRKLKGLPLLVWGKNGKMWIEEWFVRWGVGGKGACPV